MILGMPARRLAAGFTPGDYRTLLYTGDGSFPRQISTIDMSAGGLYIYNPRGVSQESRMFFRNGSGTFGKLITPNNSSTNAANSVFNASGFLINTGAIDDLANTSGWNYVAQFFQAAPDTLSIVQYTGTSANQTIPHGLSSTPEVVIVVPDASTAGSPFYVKGNPGVSLNIAQRTAPSSADFWQSTAPDATNVYIGTFATVNAAASTYSLICIGGDVCQQRIYVGNGSTTGPVVDFGFQPEAVWIKRFSGGGTSDWFILDQLRSPSFSGADLRKTMSTLAGESTANTIELATNGIKLVTTDNQFNGSGNSYLAVGFRPKP
jgi:hypothetical protein